LHASAAGKTLAETGNCGNGKQLASHLKPEQVGKASTLLFRLKLLHQNRDSITGQADHPIEGRGRDLSLA
jgi:hypothetical protein